VPGPPDDRERWNDRYRGVHPTDGAVPSDTAQGLAALLPPRGRALDVAGGPGADAVWLAGRGLDTTLVDVSDEALRIAAARAADAGVALRTVRADLTVDPLPAGPWDVVLVRHYLQRDLFPVLAVALAPGGLLCACVATRRNLERHERPSARFLVEPGELADLVAGADLEVVRAVERWTGPGPDGRHEAVVVARRADPGDPPGGLPDSPP